MVKQGKVALLKYVILGRTEIWPLIFLSLVWCACPSEAQDPKETLARLAEAYQGHFSSIAFHETNVQRIVSEDLTRSRVISDITTNEVDVKVSNGTAIVTHQTYIGPDSSGELVESRTQRLTQMVNRDLGHFPAPMFFERFS